MLPRFVLRPQRRTSARWDTAPTLTLRRDASPASPVARAYRGLLDFAFGSPCLVEGNPGTVSLRKPCVATYDIPLAEETKVFRREIEALDRGGLALRDGEGRPIPPREEACDFPFRGIDATSWYLPRLVWRTCRRVNILLGHR